MMWRAWSASAHRASLASAAIVGVEVGGERIRLVGSGWAFGVWLGALRRHDWESCVIARFATAVEPGDIVLDVGAWVGVYALLASHKVGSAGHVYAFEPDPQARRALVRNVHLNRCKNVTVLPLAVSDSDRDLFLPAGELGTSMTRLSGFGVARVQATTLDSFCAQHHLDPAVIKVDIEGAEMNALSLGAAGATLRRARSVFVEVHTPMGANLESLERIFTEVRKRPVELSLRPNGITNIEWSLAA